MDVVDMVRPIRAIALDEDVGEAVRSVVRNCILAAQQQLAPRIEDVHEARKRLREARSCLRLARAGLSGHDQEQLTGALREASTRLSALRDAEALAERLLELERDPPSHGVDARSLR